MSAVSGSAASSPRVRMPQRFNVARILTSNCRRATGSLANFTRILSRSAQTIFLPVRARMSAASAFGPAPILA